MIINNKPLSDYLKMIEDYLDLNGNYSILLAATHPNKHCIEYQCQDNINNDIMSLYVNLKNDKIYNPELTEYLITNYPKAFYDK